MPSIPLSSGVILAARASFDQDSTLLFVGLLVFASVWLTSTLLSYGALALAVQTRFSRRARIRPYAKRRRVPRMLRTAYRQGLVALVCVAPYLGYNLYRFVTSRTTWDYQQIAEIGRDLGEYVALAGPFAAAAIVPLGVSWLWMSQLHREPLPVGNTSATASEPGSSWN
ncbi:hypothetical protein DES53_104211 [Roseimicrobium gellanilyticum]|uniref:Uncharacterized protein n=1 Tax=Roseimicrobium gellanilyticum TaxID=748857 RepID=A0A366HPE6_9BACT|nr:hypothetical protein [Roseimicrobium gellanilyticum]RBP44391.1 hypothetical protein DES53_104211 [Roseimicrobium gellanilyticum]